MLSGWVIFFSIAPTNDQNLQEQKVATGSVDHLFSNFYLDFSPFEDYPVVSFVEMLV